MVGGLPGSPSSSANRYPMEIPAEGRLEEGLSQIYLVNGEERSIDYNAIIRSLSYF